MPWERFLTATSVRLLTFVAVNNRGEKFVTMDDIIIAFEHIAPFLTQPLVLVGFVLMMVFSIHKQLLKAGILPKLNQQQGSRIVGLLLRYGFILGLLITLLGFGWKFYETYANKEVNTSKQATETSANINQIVTTLINKSQLDLQAKDGQIKALTQAVTALSTGKGVDASPSELSAASSALAQGNTTLAKSLFAKTADKAEQQAKLGAEALRNLGALAFLDNTQEALQAYRRATQLDPGNAEGWNRLGHLLFRVGDLTEAIAAYNTVKVLGEQHGDKREIAAAYGNLGNVYRIRGDLDKAIEFQQKALKLEEDLSNKQGMANAYGNLGIVYKTRGDLDKAIEFYQKTLKLEEDLGNKEGMAANYGNLGIIYKIRGDLDKAIEFQQQALKLEEDLGNKEGMAAEYGNLGVVYGIRGDLDKAIEFQQKALKLEEDLGNKEGMAADYGNLGIIYKMRGDLDKAIEFQQQALKLHEDLGNKEGMAQDYGNLGNIYKTRGNFDKAIDFYQQSLNLDEALGEKEGMANTFGNLGNIYKLKGNMTEAKHYYLKSKELFTQLGSPNAKKVQTWLDALQ